MYHICAGQIKAARALLDWSQGDLASATGLSVATIRNLELGFISPRLSTTNVVRQAVEKAGLEFIDPEGIRRRLEEVKIYHGLRSSEAFFEDIKQTIQEKGGEIIAIIKSQEMLTQLCNAAHHNNLEPTIRLKDLAEIKCIIPEIGELPSTLLEFQLRAISKHYIDLVPFYVYGDKYAVVLQEGTESFRIVVFQSMAIAQLYRYHFYSLWDKALSTGANKKP